MRVIVLIEKEFEDLEFWYPVLRLMEEEIEVVVAGPIAQVEFRGKHGVPALSTVSFEEINAVDFDGIIVPGGWAPDRLRRFPAVLDLIKEFDANNKPIGHICHGGWVLISANVVRGKHVTSTPAIKDDLVNAGAKWQDSPVVVDGNQISSRKPLDLPFFTKAFIDKLYELNDKESEDYIH